MKTDNASKNCILTADVAKRKLRRMAFEVAERNADCDELIIAAVAGNGEVVAKILIEELKKILGCTITPIVISINKKQPLEAVVNASVNYNEKTIIVVDDVADSGRTLFYAIKPFLSFQPRRIQTLVLVERSHKLFPIQSDFVGLSIATTLQEHISVETERGNISGAWLH